MNDALKASGRLAYYASQIPGKDTWYQEPGTGYRLYKNVPICRTGSQQYLGREIKKNPGYNPEWNIGDEELVTVYRPLDEVTHPTTIASFEAKSVLDEHPPDPRILIDALDEYEGVSMGHGQNVRSGGIMMDGETCLVADLWVKHPELNMKIDGGIRDISCGYTFRLDKDEHGRYIQKEIRGNHIAVVPRGRAGKLVGIGDAAPDPVKPKGFPAMSKLLRALGFREAVKDAKPEEIEGTLSEIEQAAFERGRLQGVKDADEAAAAKKKKEEDEEGGKDGHGKDCDCKDCMAARDEAELPASERGRDGMNDADDDEDDEDGSKDEADVILPESERGKSVFSVGDAAKLLDIMKPAIAKSKDVGAKDAYMKLRKGFRSVAKGVKDGAPDPFAALTRISASEGAADAEPAIPMYMFFNGVPFKEGLAKWNEYQASRQTRN